MNPWPLISCGAKSDSQKYNPEVSIRPGQIFTVWSHSAMVLHYLFFIHSLRSSRKRIVRIKSKVQSLLNAIIARTIVWDLMGLLFGPNLLYLSACNILPAHNAILLHVWVYYASMYMYILIINNANIDFGSLRNKECT